MPQKFRGETDVEESPDPLKWASGRDGSIELEWGNLKWAFPSFEELDHFLDALGDIRNDIAERLQEEDE